MNMNDKPVPANIECQSEIDKDLVRTYYGDIEAFYRVRAALAATPAVGGEREALEKILQRLSGPSSAQLWDIRQIAEGALAAPPASPLLADEPEVEEVRQIAFGLSAKQQYRLAFLISENIGYALKSNDPLAELSVDGHPLADRAGCGMSELGEYIRALSRTET